MKLEPRGKYAGVKIHLDGPETMQVLAFDTHKPVERGIALAWLTKLQKKMKGMEVEHPDYLKPRTPEQIREELELELKKATEKLAKMDKGEVWNEDSTSK